MTKHEDCMSPRCGCTDCCVVAEAADEARRKGIVVGLEMAAKFLAMSRRAGVDDAGDDEAASMIKAAILTVKN